MNKILLAALTLFACMSMYANEKVVAKLSTAPASAGVMTADRAVTYTLKIYEGNADASVPSNLIYTKDYPVTETMT